MKNIIFLMKIPIIVYRKILYFINWVQNYLLLNLRGVNYGKNFKINGILRLYSYGKLVVGNNCLLNSGQKFNPVSYRDFTEIRIAENSSIVIGNNVGMSNVNIYCQVGINIGNNVLIGGGTSIWDTDFHSITFKERIIEHESNIKSKPIIIEDNVFIGANVTILKGVTIGKGAVIGALSVVTKSIPENEIWAGNPARFIKTISQI